jgi:predicted nucleic acid-binding protein
MVGIDSTFLSLLLHPKARPPLDPATNKPLERAEERIEFLIEELTEDGERILVPTPVLSEFLVLAGKDASTYLDEISARRTLLIVPFDQKAAIELAALEIADRQKLGKRGGSTQAWQKVKLDRQIVATAKANNAKRFLTDDTGIRAFAERAGMKVTSTWELPLPPSNTPLLDGVNEPPIDLRSGKESDETTDDPLHLKTGRKIRQEEE